MITDRCTVRNGGLSCILPAGHRGMHLQGGVLGVADDGRLYTTGWRKPYGPMLRCYLQPAN